MITINNKTEVESIMKENPDILIRSNKDKSVNNYGHRFIEFLKLHNILIVNGRIGKDRGIGEFTCFKEESRHVVDYFLLSPELITQCQDFEVGKFERALSDVHCPIFCILPTCVLTSPLEIHPKEDKLQSKIKWDRTKVNDYSEALKDANFETLNKLLKNENVDLNAANDMLSNILKTTAEKVMGRRYVYQNTMIDKKKSSTLKFEGILKVKRGVYRRAKRRFVMQRNDRNRIAMNKAFRQYKAEIKSCKEREWKKFNMDLKSMKFSDPRNYWKYFNKKKPSRCEAEIEDLFQFFKNLNDTTSEGEENEILGENEGIENIPNLSDAALNRPFTQSEIEKI